MYFVRARVERRRMATENEKRKRKESSDVRSKKKKKQRSEDEEATKQLRFFESAMGIELSSLELESLKDNKCILEVSEAADSDVTVLGKTIRAAFGASWKEALCEGKPVEGKVIAGSPAVLIITSSALRCIDLLRGFRSMTEQCHAAKLFSKHMKLEEQVH
ncbi:hypothetical protein AAZX31_20G233000 [Glycine max]